MSRVIAIGIGVPFGGRGSFSPASLFAAGEQGLWYDPSDFSTMFQDSAGTIPVTAVGDPVGKINDKSGRGNHSGQATPTSRPILRQDATGRYYLEFDGTDDFLSSSAQLNPGSVDKLQCFAGVYKASDAAAGVVFEHSSAAASTAGTYAILAPNSASSATYQFLNRGATTLQTATSTSSYAAPNLAVVSGIGDLASPSAEIRLNGATNTTVTTSTGGGNYSSRFLFIGRRGGTTVPFNGRLYGMIIRFSSTNLTSAAASSVEAWINVKTGAY